MLLACQESITPLEKPGNPNNPNNPENPGSGSGKFTACVPVLTNTSFDIATWNIEQFTKQGNATVEQVADIILSLNADIIAVQEISNYAQFTALVNALPGWSGVTSGGSLRTGYLYKTSEVSVSTVSYPLVDSYAFPRSPMFITATHTSGLKAVLINLHLKCCDSGSSIPQRQQASQKLKAYLDTNLPNEAVVMLGDYNEDITQPEGNYVFDNFINDATNYRFADMEIARGPSTHWSYPSWPSHLDHILVTNELFAYINDVRVLRLNECDATYYNISSDHRPVLMSLE